MAETPIFANIGPALWNRVHPVTHSSLLTDKESASFLAHKTTLFSGSLALKAPLIGMHYERCYINV